ncbi:MAG: hypothetical protein L0H53_07290 [Candidatus Nitrosocosmicus sp.]|nr:hypothetical protein [Candidatus Nitrosocosmicus sp.]MDN5867067.1 hypothetical protein [Candidatus Nitrosocosmicus sp.]
MNTRVIYAVGIGIIIVGVVFYLFNIGFLSQNSESNNNPELVVNGTNNVSTQSNQPSSSSPPETTELTPQQLNSQNLSLSVNSVKVISVNNESRLETVFNVYNPNRGSAILETVTYNVYLDNVRVGSGDVGSRPEGFVDSLESVYTIIGNQSIVLRDREPLTEEATSLFDAQGNIASAMVDNSNSSTSQAYDVNGTYFYTLNRGSEVLVREHEFNFQYPLG